MYFSNGSGEEDESEVEIELERPNAVQIDENPEGTTWSNNMNGNQGSPQHNEQGSQMAATGTRDEQEAANNHDKQVRIHIA